MLHMCTQPYPNPFLQLAAELVLRYTAASLFSNNQLDSITKRSVLG